MRFGSLGFKTVADFDNYDSEHVFGPMWIYAEQTNAFANFNQLCMVL